MFRAWGPATRIRKDHRDDSGAEARGPGKPARWTIAATAWLLGVLSLAPGPASSPEKPTLKATIHMAKAVYLQGEPIELAVAITNLGPGPIALPLYGSMPFYREQGLLRFDWGSTRLIALPERLFGSYSGLLQPCTNVPSQQTWTAWVFLQEFVQPPTPGKYRLTYTFEISYGPGGPPRNAVDIDVPWSHTAHGPLHFTVQAAAPGALEAVAKAYLRQVRDADRRRDRVAITALCMMDDPVVIPYLADLLKTDAREDGLDALERFGAQDAARRVVVAALEDDEGLIASGALHVLTQWRQAVGIEILRTLLGRAAAGEVDPQTCLRYLQVIARPEYRAAQADVVALLRSEDPVVVALALDVLAAWRYPPEPELRSALAVLAGSLGEVFDDDLRLAFKVLDEWGVELKPADLRVLLEKEDLTGVGPGTALAYLRRADRRGDSVLTPQVAALLGSRSPAVVVQALELLDRWGYALKPEERRAILERDDEAREAALKYPNRDRSP